MSASKASAAYAELDRLATNALVSKARKAARRTNWRKYAVWAKGWRKKFFSSLPKATAYWNQIKAFGSKPIIESRTYKFVVGSLAEAVITAPRPAMPANDNKRSSRSITVVAPRINTRPVPKLFPWELWHSARSLPAAPIAVMAGAVVMMILASLPV